MQVKKFEAPSLQEALDAIKRELGPEAIILQTKRHRKRFGLLSKPSFEVTAAVSERSMIKKQAVEVRLREDGKATLQKLPAERQAQVHNKFFDRYLDRAAAKTQDRLEIQGARGVSAAPRKMTSTQYIDIKDEGSTASGAMAQPAHPPLPTANSISVPVAQSSAASTDFAFNPETTGGALSLLPKSTLFTSALQDAFEQLVINGVDKRLALDLLKKVGFELGMDKAEERGRVLDEVASELMKGTEVLSLLGGLKPGERAQKGAGPFILALTGVTGVGKTTTISKLAAESMQKRGLKVGLVNFDRTKPTAFEQLATYAAILNVPFRSASSTSDLKNAISEFQGMDLILIDTAGRPSREVQSLKEEAELLDEIAGLETALVLSSTTRDAELYEIAHRFSVFRPRGLVLSKLDEASIYGAVYNICRKTKLPLLYFTTGQKVPEDLEEATRERVAALVMEL